MIGLFSHRFNIRDAGHEITGGDSNDYTTVDDNLVTAEPLTNQAIIDTVRGSQPDEVEIESAPTHTEALAMCDLLLAYLTWRLDLILTTTSRMIIPFTSSSIMNNIVLNNKPRSLIFSCNISVVCNKLHVVFNNESENKMKAINFVFSILCQTYRIIAYL